MRSPPLFALIALCAALAIVGATGELHRPLGLQADTARAMVWAFKPLATLLLLVSVRPRASLAPRYARWIGAGLLCSLVGDVLLIEPRWFVFGLLAFLLAHVCYLRAFTLDAGFAARRGPYTVVALIAAAVLAALWAGVPPGLRVPVLAYVILLATMVAQAWSRAAVTGTEHARVAAIGAALFMLSDALLALDRFGTRLAFAPLWVLPAYWLAQAQILRSIPRPSRR